MGARQEFTGSEGLAVARRGKPWRVTRQAPAPATRRLVLELQAKRQHEGEDTLEKRLPIAQELGDGLVLPCPFARLSPCIPHVARSSSFGRHHRGNTLK